MEKINKNAIHAALTLVHKTERTSEKPNGLPRARAVDEVLRTGPVLTHTEVDILLNALHVSRTELSVQWSEKGKPT
jgi:hypothetical protein